MHKKKNQNFTKHDNLTNISLEMKNNHKRPIFNFETIHKFGSNHIISLITPWYSSQSKRKKKRVGCKKFHSMIKSS